MKNNNGNGEVGLTQSKNQDFDGLSTISFTKRERVSRVKKPVVANARVPLTMLRQASRLPP